MADRCYTLALEGRDICTVVEEDGNFPKMFGRYEVLAAVANVPELRHVMDYVAFSVRVEPLYQDDRVDEVSSEEEGQFADLIEADGWMLRHVSRGLDQNQAEGRGHLPRFTLRSA
jgi:hypothetical protein